MRHHLGGAAGHGLQQRYIGAIVARSAAAFGVKVVDHVVGQCAQLRVLLRVRKMLKVAKAHKAGRHAGHHGCGFLGFAPHRRVRAGHAQGAGGGNAQGVHGLAAQKLADRTAQHCAAVAPAGIGRGPGAFELHLVACQFAQRASPPVTQLPGPDAKLVAAVNAGRLRRTKRHLVAGKGLQMRVRRGPIAGKAELSRQGVIAPNPVGRGQR